MLAFNTTISVALCTYNGGRYLNQQLDSILSQSVTVSEIVVCDDGSTDESVNILKTYQSLYPQLFKVYFNSQRLGTVKNFEKALSLVKGEIIFLADQDDIWLPQKVERMVAFMIAYPNALLYFTNGFLINSLGDIIDSTLFTQWNFSSPIQELWLDNKEAVKMLINNVNKVTGATLCIRSNLLDIAMPIDTPCGYWHDVWLAMHAAKYDGLFFTNECLIKYRVHEAQQVGLKDGNSELLKASICKEKKRKFESYLKKNFSGYYKFYRRKSSSRALQIFLKVKTILNGELKML